MEAAAMTGPISSLAVRRRTSSLARAPDVALDRHARREAPRLPRVRRWGLRVCISIRARLPFPRPDSWGTWDETVCEGLGMPVWT